MINYLAFYYLIICSFCLIHVSNSIGCYVCEDKTCDLLATHPIKKTDCEMCMSLETTRIDDGGKVYIQSCLKSSTMSCGEYRDSIINKTGLNTAQPQCCNRDYCNSGNSYVCKDFGDKFCQDYKLYCATNKFVKASCGVTCNSCDYFDWHCTDIWSSSDCRKASCADKTRENFFCRKTCQKCPLNILEKYHNSKPDGANLQRLHNCKDIDKIFCKEYKDNCPLHVKYQVICPVTCDSCIKQYDVFNTCIDVAESENCQSVTCQNRDFDDYLCKKSCNLC